MTGPRLNAAGDLARNGGSNWTASAEWLGGSTGVGGRSDNEDETDEDECDELENFGRGMWKYDRSPSSSPSVSSSELKSSPSSSRQFSIGDNDIEPRVVDFGGRATRGWVTSSEVSSLGSPLEVYPGCLGRVGGEVCIG